MQEYQLLHLNNLIFQVHKVPFVKIEDLVLPQTGTSCVDERTNYTSPAVFGGDWGIFLTTIIALNHDSVISNDIDTLKELFIQILDAYNKYGLRFYTHTDNHAPTHKSHHIGCGFTKVVLNHIRESNPKLSEGLAHLYNQITHHEFTHPALLLDKLTGEHNASIVTIIKQYNNYPASAIAMKRQVLATQNNTIYNLMSFVYNPTTEYNLLAFMLRTISANSHHTYDSKKIIQSALKTANRLNRLTSEQLTTNAEYILDATNNTITHKPQKLKVKELPIIEIAI